MLVFEGVIILRYATIVVIGVDDAIWLVGVYALRRYVRRIVVNVGTATTSYAVTTLSVWHLHCSLMSVTLLRVRIQYQKQRRRRRRLGYIPLLAARRVYARAMRPR